MACMLLTEKDTAHDMMGRSRILASNALSSTIRLSASTAFTWGVASNDAGTQTGEFLSHNPAQESM